MQLALVLFALTSSVLAAPAENQKLRKADGETKPNSYIIKLKDGASTKDSIESLNSLVSTSDSIVQIGYTDWSAVNAYTAVLTGAALEHVLGDPNVEYVEEDRIVKIDYAIKPRAPQSSEDPTPSPEPNPDPEPQPQPDSVQNSQSDVDAAAVSGAGTNFYGVDTGIRITHRAFTGRASWGATFGGYPNIDDNGHGTHTAGTAAGVGFGLATQSKLYAVKVLSGGGSGAISDVIAGVNWAVNHAIASRRPSVVNMSLGGGASPSLDQAVRTGIQRGVHFSIAAGNSNVPADNTSPARVLEAVTVGAVGSNFVKACFSNYGRFLDVWDFGVNIKSSWNTGDTATNTISGTSMATPGVSGKLLVALGKFGQMAPATLITRLRQQAQAKVICTRTPCGSTPQTFACSQIATTNLMARAF